MVRYNLELLRKYVEESGCTCNLNDYPRLNRDTMIYYVCPCEEECCIYINKILRTLLSFFFLFFAATFFTFISMIYRSIFSNCMNSEII